MEDKKVLLNGKQIFACVRIIKNLNVKDDLIRIFTQANSNEKVQNDLNKEILAKMQGKDGTEDNIKELFKKDKALAKKFVELQANQSNVGFELIYLILEHIDYAEDEIFKLLAEVYKEDVEELKNNPEKGEELIPMISGVIKSDSFQKVFTFISK